MATEVIAVPKKRGRPKKAAISPLELPLTAKSSKGRVAAAAAEAAPKAIGRTEKNAEPAQPKEAIEIQECVDRDTKTQARSGKGKNSAGTRTGETTKWLDGERKGTDELQRARSETVTARVLKIGDAILEEGSAIRPLRRQYGYQKGLNEPSSAAPGTITELVADVDAAAVLNEPVPVPASLEDTRTLEHPAVASPPSTSSLAIRAVDVPTPPSLLVPEPPSPALVLPNASTSPEPPHQGPLPQSKILTALAEELQHQTHRLSPAASPESIPSAIKPAPGPTRMARPSPPTAPRKPHSAPVPPPPRARKARPLIPLPSPSPPPTSPIPSAKPDKLKATSRKYTMVMVALPIAIVTSWALFERLALGKEQKTLVRWPDAPAATSTAGVKKPES